MLDTSKTPRKTGAPTLNQKVTAMLASRPMSLSGQALKLMPTQKAHRIARSK